MPNNNRKRIKLPVWTSNLYQYLPTDTQGKPLPNRSVWIEHAAIGKLVADEASGGKSKTSSTQKQLRSDRKLSSTMGKFQYHRALHQISNSVKELSSLYFLASLNVAL